MSDPRLKTSFERDVRELIAKLFLTCLCAVALQTFAGWESWPISIGVSIGLVFLLGWLVKNDGRDAERP